MDFDENKIVIGKDIMDMSEFNDADWEEMRNIAKRLMDDGLFDADLFKCTITAALAYVIYINNVDDFDSLH